MQLDPGAFNAFLADIGQRYQWRRSFACPCINPNSGAAKPGCLQCNGRGRLWDAAVSGVAGMAGSKIQQSWQQFGLYEPGDVVVTIPENTPLYDVRQYDRVVALDNTDGFSLTLIRGQNDRLVGPIKTVTRVFWLDDAQAIVEGGIPTVSGTGALTWSSGAPPAGKTYAITGERYVELFCWGDYPSDRGMHSGARLPKRVVLRKFDLFGRSGKTA